MEQLVILVAEGEKRIEKYLYPTSILHGQLKEKMAKGWAVFAYEKKDGSLRTAIGTTNPKLIEERIGLAKEGTGKKAQSEGVVNYFDLEAGGFRRYDVVNLKMVI